MWPVRNKTVGFGDGRSIANDSTHGDRNQKGRFVMKRICAILVLSMYFLTGGNALITPLFGAACAQSETNDSIRRNTRRIV